MITQERLKILVSYDPETGAMIWLRRRINGSGVRYNTQFAGRDVGSPINHGCLDVQIDGRHYQVHRLAWLYVYGEWPPEVLDHINGNPADNRLSNLRPATQAQNVWNRGRYVNNTSGFTGVFRYKDRWRAKINVSGRQIHLGTFRDRDLAHVAYVEAAIAYFGQFARAA